MLIRCGLPLLTLLAVVRRDDPCRSAAGRGRHLDSTTPHDDVTNLPNMPGADQAAPVVVEDCL